MVRSLSVRRPSPLPDHQAPASSGRASIPAHLPAVSGARGLVSAHHRCSDKPQGLFLISPAVGAAPPISARRCCPFVPRRCLCSSCRKFWCFRDRKRKSHSSTPPPPVQLSCFKCWDVIKHRCFCFLSACSEQPFFSREPAPRSD